MSIKTIEGSPDAGGGRFAVVVGRWYQEVVGQLQRAALDTLREHGVSDDDITVIHAPGAFEIPLVCKTAAASGRYDAIVALGAVIRGATPHFDYVAGECAGGLARTSTEYGLPVAFGVLTVDTMEQALQRSGDGPVNKGREAALAALEMVSLLKQLAP